MKPRYSSIYLDGLFSSEAYADLVQLSSLLCATEGFSLNKDDYGLPGLLFVFVETLTWLAQSWRSGVWTYYEAAPPNRQETMHRALRSVAAHPALIDCYREGMHSCRDPDAMRKVDDWIKRHDDVVVSWLRTLVRVNRSTIEKFSS